MTATMVTRPRRILICPDSFKGTLTAPEVADAIAEGWCRARPGDHVEILPLADGGEGTCEVLALALEGCRTSWATVTGPDGRPVRAAWLEMANGAAVVELAAACGLPLLAEPMPMTAHTYGLGELIAEAASAGCDPIFVALGGSASTDAGMGALSALGVAFLDGAGRTLTASAETLGLVRTYRLPADPRLPEIRCLVDVESPLYGSAGAAFVFAPQKGADSQQVRQLDEGLRSFASVVAGDPDAAGTGAAGGTAYGLASILGAQICPGAPTILDLLGFDELLNWADCIVTGEGRLDKTSTRGKIVGEVAGRISGTRTLTVIAGSIEDHATPRGAIAISLTQLAGSEHQAKGQARHWLRVAGEQAARLNQEMPVESGRAGRQPTAAAGGSRAQPEKNAHLKGWTR